MQWTDAMIKLMLTEMNKYVESFTSSVRKQVWKNIAASMNIHGYNLSVKNYIVKWTAMKKKYKALKDANNKTGAAGQTWKYDDIINNLLSKNQKLHRYL